MTWRQWFSAVDLGHVSPWNGLIADQHAAATERMLLGWCGPARTVGNRRDEAIIADRERRAAEMSMRGRVFQFRAS
jgi:hypothetical protein